MGRRHRTHEREETAGSQAKTPDEQDTFQPAVRMVGTQRLGDERGYHDRAKVLVCYTNKHVKGKTERF